MQTNRLIMATLLLVLVLQPVWAGDGSTEEQIVLYPQFVIGQGFEVVLVVTNASQDPWNGTGLLAGFDGGANPTWLLNGQQQNGNQFPVSLGPRATKRYVFSAPNGAAAAAGALEIRPSQGSSTANLAASFFYDYSVDGELVDSIGVAAAEQARTLVIPVERFTQQRINTGLAVRTRSDASPAAATPFKISLYDEQGLKLEETNANTGARFFDQIFSPAAFPQGDAFTGSVAIESNTPLYVVALRQRLLDGGRFQLTGVPAWTSPDLPPAPASFSARYQVVFQATWSSFSHPTDFPANPHFSPLIGGVHKGSVSFWQPGQTASEGMERMAELGSISPLNTEVQIAINSNNAKSILVGPGIGRSPGQAQLEFEVNQDFSFVTLVSMIAPSPDWFVGVSGLDLFQNGDWVQELVVELPPWDAGTDSGLSYQSPDIDTQPRGVIQQITGGPFLNQGIVQPMGTYTFRRLDSN